MIIKFILSLFLTFLLLSCNKNDEAAPTCGCESPTVNTISNVNGVLIKNSGNFKNENITSDYYIQSNNGESGISTLEICNKNITAGILLLKINKLLLFLVAKLKTFVIHHQL